MTRWIAWALVCGIALPFPRTSGAQSHSDLAGFNALIVSPVGALPPMATDNGKPSVEQSYFAVRYGRWRFDIDDAIHGDAGLTFGHRIATSNTSLSASVAYLSASCDCSGWMSGGVSLRSMVWSNAPRTERGTARATGHVTLELDGGGARFQGAGHAVGYSASAGVDIGGSVAIGSSSRIAFSVIPGFGVGRSSTFDETGVGVRPMYGAALSWKLMRGLSIDFGARKIELKDGPTQIGGGLSWFKL